MKGFEIIYVNVDYKKNEMWGMKYSIVILYWKVKKECTWI